MFCTVYSNRVADNPAVDKRGHRVLHISFMEHVCRRVLGAQSAARRLAVPLPREPQVPARVRRIRQSLGRAQTHVHCKHRREPGNVSGKYCKRLLLIYSEKWTTVMLPTKEEALNTAG